MTLEKDVIWKMLKDASRGGITACSPLFLTNQLPGTNAGITVAGGIASERGQA